MGVGDDEELLVIFAFSWWTFDLGDSSVDFDELNEDREFGFFDSPLAVALWSWLRSIGMDGGIGLNKLMLVGGFGDVMVSLREELLFWKGGDVEVLWKMLGTLRLPPGGEDGLIEIGLHAGFVWLEICGSTLVLTNG